MEPALNANLQTKYPFGLFPFSIQAYQGRGKSDENSAKMNYQYLFHPVKAVIAVSV
jgi:hypothetical protein